MSKWNLASAAVDSENSLAYVGSACLLLSALLTAIYMLTIVVRAFFPGKDYDGGMDKNIKDPNWKMMLPLVVFSVCIVVFGLYSSPIVTFLSNVANGAY